MVCAVVVAPVASAAPAALHEADDAPSGTAELVQVKTLPGCQVPAITVLVAVAAGPKLMLVLAAADSEVQVSAPDAARTVPAPDVTRSEARSAALVPMLNAFLRIFKVETSKCVGRWFGPQAGSGTRLHPPRGSRFVVPSLRSLPENPERQDAPCAPRSYGNGMGGAADGAAVSDGDGLAEGGGVRRGFSVGVGVGGGVGAGDTAGSGVGAGVATGVGEGVDVGVGAGVRAGVATGVGVGVGAGVGAAVTTTTGAVTTTTGAVELTVRGTVVGALV
jgi:hypothetical protein